MGHADAATGPRWIIEQTQLAQLPWSARQHITATAGSVILADTAAAFGQNGTNAEHYTTIAPCTQLMMNAGYVAKCLSLDAAPPPAGTYALYDPEGWTITPTAEYQNQCKAFADAAALIKAAGATAIMAPSNPRRQDLVQCAARAAATTGGEVMVHLQVQPWETDLSTYMHYLRQATRWAHAAVPGITVSFGVSTNPKYSATAHKMFYAWQAATGYLGLAAPCWLNIVPVKDAEVTMAARFLSLVYG